jgi:hypothetical protein
MIVEGRVVDQNGNPVQGIAIKTQVYQHGYIDFFENYEVMSYTETDADGRYVMMFPRPKYEEYINILINTDEQRHPVNAAYSNTIIYNIKQKNFNDYIINLSEQVIFQPQNTTILEVVANDDPLLDGMISSVKVDGMVTENIVDYNFGGSDADQEHLYYNSYNVATNSMVILKYAIKTGTDEEPLYTITEVPVSIGSEPVIYTINF